MITVLNTIEEVSSRRRVDERFKVSPSIAIRWRKSLEESRVDAKPLGGDRRLHHVEAHADLILSLYEAGPTIFQSELKMVLSERGTIRSESGLSGPIS